MVTRRFVALSTHNGTRLDAPWHFPPTMDGGQRAITIDEVPLDWCFRPGVKLDFTRLPNSHVVTGAEVEAELKRIGYTLQPYDIVLVNTAAGKAVGEPDELGSSWGDGRVDLPLVVEWNGRKFGAASGYPMAWSLAELVAHAAATRDLVAGTIIGTGTVSNPDFRDVGSSCIAEKRGIETIDEGKARTEYMKFGDRVRMEARPPSGAPLFGAIDRRVILCSQQG